MVSAQLSLDFTEPSPEDLQTMERLLRQLWHRALQLFWEDGEPLEPVQQEARKLRDAVEQTAMEYCAITHGKVPRKTEKLLHMVVGELEWYLARRSPTTT